MSSIYPRGSKLYAKLKDLSGKWKAIATGFDVGQEAEAAKWVADMEREVERTRVEHEKHGGPVTVASYAQHWLGKRKTKTVGNDRARIELHLLPRIGDRLIKDITPLVMRDVIMSMRDQGQLSSKTIREVAGVTHTMFKSAVIEGIVATNPCVYERGVLPKKADKDPHWRAQAIYTRTEIEQILTDERIPYDRRLLYAMKFFTGRHTEVAISTWSKYDPTTKPLGTLHLAETKSGVPRAVPVHPVLEQMLTAWWSGGWEQMYGRRPTLEDLIVMTRRGHRRYKADATQKQFIKDLARIGLRVKASSRNRRGHDLRRTLITLSRADGALDSMLRWVTHGGKPGEILDVYSTPPWEALCAEVMKLRLNVLHRLGSPLVHLLGPGDTSSENERPRRD